MVTAARGRSLEQQLRSGTDAKRAEAALRLADLDSPAAVSALTEALSDPATEVRAAAGLALASLRDPASIPALAEIVAGWDEPTLARCRRAALRALAAFRGQEAAVELARALATVRGGPAAGAPGAVGAAGRGLRRAGRGSGPARGAGACVSARARAGGRTRHRAADALPRREPRAARARSAHGKSARGTPEGRHGPRRVPAGCRRYGAHGRPRGSRPRCPGRGGRLPRQYAGSGHRGRARGRRRRR